MLTGHDRPRAGDVTRDLVRVLRKHLRPSTLLAHDHGDHPSPACAGHQARVADNVQAGNQEVGKDDEIRSATGAGLLRI